ncbi:MAG: hypothetical protein EPO65_03325 [Dehalococcoidia bacterium]|nr:MAG: hypothetical protein EPO65_03325 [Dehalococcoidia bacterium]
MTFTRTVESPAALSRPWLAAIAGTAFAAITLVAALIQPATAVTVNNSAPSTQAVAPAEEPWTPSTILYGGSGSVAPTQHRLPLSLDDLDPECTCIGFF